MSIYVEYEQYLCQFRLNIIVCNWTSPRTYPHFPLSQSPGDTDEAEKEEMKFIEELYLGKYQVFCPSLLIKITSFCIFKLKRSSTLFEG